MDFLPCCAAVASRRGLGRVIVYAFVFRSSGRLRFFEYELYPYRWTMCVHPAASEADREEVFDEFFDEMKHCCRGECFDTNVVRLCVGDKHRMEAAKQWWDGFRALCFKFRFTGMSMESLFACFRQWLKSDRAEVERMIATGFLGQWLQEHIRRGGCQPHAPTARCGKGEGENSQGQPQEAMWYLP